VYVRSDPIVLSIDLGSSSLKGVAFDQYGRALAGLEGRVKCGLRFSRDGGAEIDLERTVRAADELLDALHARSGSREVLAVSLTSIASSLIALDALGKPVGAALSYADTRSTAEVAGVPDRREVTGCPPFTAYWPAQVRWWRKQHPSLEPTRLCSLADYLLLHWFGGAPSTTFSLASWTGCLDRHRLTWDLPTLEAAQLEAAQLPALTDFDLPRRGLSQEFCTRWPKFAEIPFFPAVGDGAAANVGSGALGPSRVALTIGSTSAIRAALAQPSPPLPGGLWSYRISRGHTLLGGAVTEGGNLHAWLRDTLNLGSLHTLDERLAALEPDGHGLTFIPSLGGERSPNYNAQARGTLHGLNFATSPLEIMRAGMEGVAYRLSDLADRLTGVLEMGVLEHRETASGVLETRMPGAGARQGRPSYIASGRGLLSSRVWLQMLSDALGAEVLVSDAPDEATARGGALLALGACGLLDPFDPPPLRSGWVFAPSGERHEIYRQGLERQKTLMTRLTDTALAEAAKVELSG